jgi:hypothetical protein
MGVSIQFEAKKTKMDLLGGMPTLGSLAAEAIGHASSM